MVIFNLTDFRVKNGGDIHQLMAKKPILVGLADHAE